MQLRDGMLVFSPTDLSGFAECEHLTRLEMRRARGEIERPDHVDDQAELLRQKGLRHETDYLAGLKAQGLTVAEIAGPDAVADTVAAMVAGADVVYQAAFDHAGWTGYADFLMRVEQPSALGSYSYEPADTKLARHAKPAYLLQLCFYAEQIARVQQREPEHLLVVLGDLSVKRFRRADYDAYYRMLRTRFLEAVADPSDATYPWPVKHCEVCRWKTGCEDRRAEDDHLTLVANMTKGQARRLNAAGIATMADLAAQPEPLAVPKINPGTGERLLRQARLQILQRETGTHSYELLPFESPTRGFAALPEPSPGDVFFDMEGHPFFEIGGPGLEYLFGIYTHDGGYRAWWAHSRADEKRALEELVDYLTERLRVHGDMHVYHYASYETAAIKRLAGTYATREDEVDDLLRAQVFVDLYAIVRQSLRISQPSYSIKKVEPFYMDARSTDVLGGGESIVAYERWLATHDDAILDDIRSYNEDDCVSTWKLRDWLLERRAEAVARYGPLPERVAEPDAPARELKPEEREALELSERLTRDLPETDDDDTEEQRAIRLLAHLLDYHRREDRPVWWAFFDRQRRSFEDLLDDADCIAGLAHDGSAPEPVGSSSLRYRMTFPFQETKMRSGAGVVDAQTGVAAGKVESLDMANRSLILRRGPSLREVPLPTVIGPSMPVDTKVLRAALRRVASDVVDRGFDVPGRYRAVRDLLAGRPPRVRGVAPGEPLLDEGGDVGKRLPEIVHALDESVLFVQGPPGTGKTYHAAGVICSLLAAGKTVGIAANSHEAINNVLRWVETRAKESGVDFTGIRKAGASSAFNDVHITSVTDNKVFEERLEDADLVAGTAWALSRPAVDQRLDYLFIDEAGQISIADAVAMGTAAKNIVVIGDPIQLAQVSQGSHPDGAGASVLEHLLGDRQTIPDECGVFLATTWRLHPQVCDFISEVMYEGRLHPETANATADIPGVGTGLRFLPVPHEGNRQTSEEEADVICERIQSLLGREWVDRDGERRSLRPADILVVAPYNAQVRLLRERLPEGVEAGTVDKFQGKEAAVVFYSMATSSGRELPRTLEFLFGLNRLNVAISRAQCLAFIVASPDLLRVPCRTIDQMRMVNALCRYVEMATETEASR